MRRHLLAQISYASFAHYASEGLFMLRGLALASLLGPAGFGTWSSMRLVLNFSRYAHGGARAGMLQHALHASGSGDVARAERYRAVASALNLAGALGVATALALAIWLWVEREERAIWLWVVAILVARNLYGFYRTILRSHRRYALTSSMNLGFATLSLVLGLAGTLAMGLPGFLAGLGASYAIVLLAALPLGETFPRPSCRRADASLLFATGLPIMLSNVLKVLLWNVDKLLLWAMVGQLALGTYTVQSYVTNAVMLLPAAVGEVFYPHLVAELGRSGSVDTARSYLERWTELGVRIAFPVLAVVALTIHLPIRWLLPDYTDAILPGRILAFATFFPIAAMVPGAVLISLGGQRRQLVISAIAVAVAFVTIGSILLAGGGLAAVAVGAAVGLLTRGLLTTRAACARVGLGAAATVRWIARLGLPLGGAVLATLATWALVPDTAATWSADMLRTAARCALALAVLAPWAFASVRRLTRTVEA